MPVASDEFWYFWHEQMFPQTWEDAIDYVNYAFTGVARYENGKVVEISRADAEVVREFIWDRLEFNRT